MVAAGKFAVSLVQSWSEFDQHRDPWTKVWSADPHAELFTNFDWLAAIAQAYGEGLTPCCPVITRAGEPVAILPVGVRDGVLNFLSSPRGDFNDLIFAADGKRAFGDADLEEVCRLALSALDDSSLAWRNACLENVVEDAWLLKAVRNDCPGNSGHLSMSAIRRRARSRSSRSAYRRHTRRTQKEALPKKDDETSPQPTGAARQSGIRLDIPAGRTLTSKEAFHQSALRTTSRRWRRELSRRRKRSAFSRRHSAGADSALCKAKCSATGRSGHRPVPGARIRRSVLLLRADVRCRVVKVRGWRRPAELHAGRRDRPRRRSIRLRPW
jgi:hypothetical protein